MPLLNQRLVIQGRLPGTNEINRKNRGTGGWKAGASQKKQYTKMVAWACKLQKLQPFHRQINLTFKWYCKEKRRNKDNIIGAQKFVFDGLQEAGIIKNDGWAEIGIIEHDFVADPDIQSPDDEYVVIDMVEVEEFEL